MTLVATAPLLLALALVAALAVVVRRIRPCDAARLGATVLGTVLLTIFATTWVTGLAYLAHAPLDRGYVIWCRQAAAMHHPSPTVGWLSLAVAVPATARLVNVIRRWRRGRGDQAGALHILDTSDAFAFAQTGRRGGIIVSSTMLNALDTHDRAALLAHERAHLNHRHDRFLLLTSIAHGLPVLGQLGNHVRHALERWADEEAAEAVGSRVAVAGAVARAALATVPPTAGQLAAAGSDVPGRVRALASPAPLRWPWTRPAQAVAAGAVLAAALQLHHLLPLLASLARH